MKLSRHNGRNGKNGVYNVKHNDRRFDVEKSEHIRSDMTPHNIYWDCYQGYYSKDIIPENDSEIPSAFVEVEERFYDERYSDFCEKQNERNAKTRHTERNRSPDDLRQDKRTAPEETILQIGDMDEHVSADILLAIASDYYEIINDKFGEHIHILDWSLHMDEATPHIHERHVFDCENKYGEIAPQQEKALEKLGIERPDPDKPNSKTNNRKITFDKFCRTLLLDISQQHGLNLDREPEYGGRDYMDKQEYILMKQVLKIQKRNELIEEKEARLEHLEVAIADTEAFAEKVADVAYEKAVDVVTEKVAEETHNADFEMIENFKKSLLSENNKSSPDAKRIGGKVLDSLMGRFKGLTKKITEKLSGMLRSPAVREQAKEPIRESIIEELRQAQKKQQAERELRQRERQEHPEHFKPKPKKDEPEL